MTLFGVVRGALMSSPKFKQEHADALNEIEEQFESQHKLREEAQRAGLILRERVNELEEQWEAMTKMLKLWADLDRENPNPATEGDGARREIDPSDSPSVLDSSIDSEGAEAGWTGAPDLADIPLTTEQIEKAKSEIQMRAEIHGSSPAEVSEREVDGKPQDPFRPQPNSQGIEPRRSRSETSDPASASEPEEANQGPLTSGKPISRPGSEASDPSSGERVTAEESSSTSTQGASQSPETLETDKCRCTCREEPAPASRAEA